MGRAAPLDTPTVTQTPTATPEPVTMHTFDGGYQNTFDYSLNIMQSRGLTGSTMNATQFINKLNSPWFHPRPSDPADSPHQRVRDSLPRGTARPG